MTGLLLGDHNLSVERLRYPARYRDTVPREHRLCRFCRAAVEDEVHALFDCGADFRLVDLRTVFLDSLLDCDQAAHATWASLPSYEFMIRLVSLRKAVQLFAKYIFQVLNIFDGTPRYFPLVLRSPGQ
ncbi:hypothetical protein FB451DRAFT_1020108 [Mycena latifolia]|nr:hypothetical protein FB451DRAFT_1020108 [Mycena latifolia]